MVLNMYNKLLSVKSFNLVKIMGICSSTQPPSVNITQVTSAEDIAVTSAEVEQPRQLTVAPAPEYSTIEAKYTDVKFGKYFTFAGVSTIAKIVSFYDGDTVTARWFNPAGEQIQYRLRLLGYDCAEMKPPLSSPTRDAEKAAAIRAKNALVDKINNQLIYMECDEFDKYGRILATIYLWHNGAIGENLNEWMIKQGHGIPYNGKKKIQYADWIATDTV